MSKKVSQEQLRKLMGSKLKKKPTKEPFINKDNTANIIFPKSILNEIVVLGSVIILKIRG